MRGIYDANELGRTNGVVLDIDSKLAQAGKRIAKGDLACDLLNAAKAIVHREIAAGHTTAARAGNLLSDIAYVEALIGR
ncbi:MAG TPA: hypothetical protein VJ853_12320 [Thermoanaerobaculia bacterium]|nr:hypothetical protein [Thermoanaerobaculia bacterium]